MAFEPFSFQPSQTRVLSKSLMVDSQVLRGRSCAEQSLIRNSDQGNGFTDHFLFLFPGILIDYCLCPCMAVHGNFLFVGLTLLNNCFLLR